MCFAYGEQEINYLRKRDKRLGRVIDQVGIVRREVDPDLFRCSGSPYCGPADFHQGAGNGVAAGAREPRRRERGNRSRCG